ncbi:hypothetical protein IV286_05935 [Enterococcus faecium]|uniref:hypothetical protein n=1 Tax=Enterococcus faecium TaxID=1352 RepID=UPI001E3B548C|nr:hypothetical protein [Enterococcus faecium]MCD5204534.1 hypothetical protein [Enterococcus faecium]MCD5214676.1 hypothetical protein [Enterococcus faecium]MCD5224817.1 hypothetical protein [Enterococcus faecium]
MSEENIKSALQYAVNLAEGQKVIHEQPNGKTFYDENKASLKELYLIPYANSLEVNSLTGLVDYLKSHPDYLFSPLILHVESPILVKVLSPLNEDRKRECLVYAKAILDNFPFSRFMDSESFIINIMSLFDRTDDAEAIRACASSLRIEGGADIKDDGTSQVVAVKQGATVQQAKVPSPAILRPYRTFLEVEQPESPFIFRVNDRADCALFDADGGLWKYEAMNNIKEYLATALQEEIEDGFIKIIA